MSSKYSIAPSEVDALAEKLYNQLSLQRQREKKESSKVQTNLQAPTKLKFGDDVR